MSELHELQWSPDHEAIVQLDENGDPIPVPIQSLTTDEGSIGNASIGPVGLVSNQANTAAVGRNHGPQAEHIPSEEKTVVIWRGYNGHPFITYYDHQNNTFGPQTKVGSSPVNDPHGMPSLEIDDDGYLFAFYGSHNSDIQVARSANPFETTHWLDKGTLPLSGTYPSPTVVGNDLYVLFRPDSTSGDNHGSSYPAHEYATIVKSTDKADSWSDEGPVIDTTGHPDDYSDAYALCCSDNNGQLHISWWVSHGTEHDDIRSNVYHANYDPSTGGMYDLDGNSFGSTITWSQHSSGVLKAFDGDTVGYPKHAIGDDGTVYITFTHRNNGVIEQRLATYSGGWSVNQIADATTAALTDIGAPRINSDGDLEAHIITGRDYVNNIGEDRGASYEVFTKSGGSWSSEMVYQHSASEMTRIATVSCVRDGVDEFPTLFSEWDEHKNANGLNLWAYGRVPIEETIRKATSSEFANIVANSGSIGDLEVKDKFSFQIEEPTSENSNRAFGTTYQNDTGQLIRVAATFGVDADGRIDLSGFVSPNSDAVSTTTRVKRNRRDVLSGDIVSVNFFVPSGQYYQINDNTGNLSIQFWNEARARQP